MTKRQLNFCINARKQCSLAQSRNELKNFVKEDRKSNKLLKLSQAVFRIRRMEIIGLLEPDSDRNS
jgi:hypothetical protein